MKRQAKKSIKLALQGGGSHGAFAWGGARPTPRG
jgi:predicted acylesterase/phospholipase RssA